MQEFVPRSEFDEHKTKVHKRLDEIFDKLSKPQFSSNQISTFLFALISAVATIMIYITSIKSDARNNKTEITTIKEDVVEQKSNFNTIDGKLDKLLEDVATLKGKDEAKKE